jgi:hypothetical protein
MEAYAITGCFSARHENLFDRTMSVVFSCITAFWVRFDDSSEAPSRALIRRKSVTINNMKKERGLPNEEMVGMKIPAEELPQWTETLRASGFSADEVRDIISRMPTSIEQNNSSAVKNIQPAAEDMPNWIQALSDGGFTHEEIDSILERMTMSADEKAELRGTLKRTKAAYSDEDKVNVPAKVIKG